ncbi:MAG: hypothetical protein AVDCRST_MAG64-3566 [uncultured Phycisphaerae bacterium]|uniref:Uncharacterized protein n=1 Tax=uncultured Phycisphaerae bacterium TaxID=904963 RepID=A0A6J4Q1W5_9BACT|nr:MAG: hypothetical protein AVDCRST_MAG64-3566 [uncultured Phycisphaerae bacterium]
MTPIRKRGARVPGEVVQASDRPHGMPRHPSSSSAAKDLDLPGGGIVPAAGGRGDPFAALRMTTHVAGTVGATRGSSPRSTFPSAERTADSGRVLTPGL